MSQEVAERRLRQLVDRMESRLNTVHVIAEIIRDNAGLREGIPGPYLDEVGEGALMDAMVDLCRSNQQEFWQLMKLEQLALWKS
ncbi:hypothetical protein thsps21_27180 [Pseudomonas sp. No.21]|uniref:Uncharacterized protein n=1 Tax=Pseudomonas tohonis TaxID=2725477 RepID=A0A6J4E011_9PSED|nr:hypothetical protein [Pseudomonas tohonis]BCG23253.1 hypothetical protein TUM18999_14440 [Pseudomonas tohonis]GJN45199.1 hypothetical protein TUM20249_11850 [Pseudomonas tohonis]GJN55262.1 hypothetical protein TUM20286_50140 [Pseudomonas tohonis]